MNHEVKHKKLHISLSTVEQEGALTDEEIQEIADKEGLQQLREKFNDLEEELEREAVEDDNLPEGVERMLQGMIRMCRQMMAGGPKNTIMDLMKLIQSDLI